MAFTVTKTFRNLPCAHRRWQHDGHCAFIHGYSREVKIVFKSKHLDKNHFVIDFGKLKDIKRKLLDWFDHTLLIDESDPLLPLFRELERKGAAKLTVFKSVGMEGSAKAVFHWLQSYLFERFGDNVWVESVELRENDKNSATYFGGIDD